MVAIHPWGLANVVKKSKQTGNFLIKNDASAVLDDHVDFYGSGHFVRTFCREGCDSKAETYPASKFQLYQHHKILFDYISSRHDKRLYEPR